MGVDKIKVDLVVLEEQIAALKSLCNETGLRDKIESVQNLMPESQGGFSDKAATLTEYLLAIETQLSLLASRTLEFLQNSKTNYIEADEGLADRIRNS